MSRKITITTYYEFVTDQEYAEYMDILTEKFPDVVRQLRESGRAEFNSVHDTGSIAQTTYQILE